MEGTVRGPRAAADPAAPDTDDRDSATRTAGLLSLGGIVAALGAASCCVIPFALFTVGVSGAWIGNLTALAPYQPIFAGVTLACLGYGFYLVYRNPKGASPEGPNARKPGTGPVPKLGRGTGTV